MPEDMKSLICKSICVLIGLLLVACGTNTPYRAPVVDIGQEVEPSARTTVILGQGPAHRVNEGETLYAIAWMYDLDFQELALANNIPSPYVIYPGQELSLDVSNIEAQLASAPARSPVATEPPVASRNTSPTGTSQTRAAGTSNALLRWVWPANGRIISNFSAAENANKGIDISGTSGDPVYAAESGEVVYAGSALLRYGELIIIKHNDDYLSAYAHNDSLLVTEGDRVTRGQQIASLGSTGIDRDMLHFEIRLGGQPVNPANYLPPR
tara:strand:- start:253 stop:1056 length:804 start_codon:yes stop_codon:yes gene_type:complete